METIRENYPPQAFHSGLNILGTHDTPRILTLLGVDDDAPPATKDARADYRLSLREYQRGLARLKLAAILAYKDGIPKAQPVLLEPVGELRVTVPDDYVGDVMGDVNKRRGRVLGIEPCEGKAGYQTVLAEVPQPEMADYVITLRASTQGRGRFDYAFSRYEEVPANVAQKIIAAASAE
jgi:translation elongation factor EF-G